MTGRPGELRPSRDDLRRLHDEKYDAGSVGWGPRMRSRFGYFTPDDYYESILDHLITPATTWLDVGSGRNVFPSNPGLARRLADRCALLVGVDPDATVTENPFVHRAIRAPIEEVALGGDFDVISLRMVAEHLTEPRRVLGALARLCKPGGRLVIYTVNRWTPVALVAGLVPASLQNPIKNLFWRTDAKDTFPVVYRLNTRKRLARLSGEAGFRERLFLYLDDCRSFSGYRALHFLELSAWRGLRRLRLRYPENCLLGVYERT